MFRTLILGLVVSCVAFAPIPKVKICKDPDKEIKELITTGVNFDARKNKLLRSMALLKDVLQKNGENKQAEAVSERILLVESIDQSRPFSQSIDVEQLMKMGAVNGKYKGLLRVIYVKEPQNSYPPYFDFGKYSGPGTYMGNQVPDGHWVYVMPRWFIWKTNTQEKDIDRNP